MNKSEEIKDLATALCKAQSEMSGAKKKAANPFFKSKYADLKEVIDCAKDALSDNGLSISQFPVSEDGKAGVNTILMHSSGEYIESTLLLACTKQDPQAYGSAITYARRYAYQSILGIPSEDDDGQRASAPAKPTYKEPAKKSEPAKPHGPTLALILGAFKASPDLATLEAKKVKADSTEHAKDLGMIKAYEQRKQELSK